MINKHIRYATLLTLGTAIISGVSNFIAKIGVTAVKDPLAYTTLKNSLVAFFLVGIICILHKYKEVIRLNFGQIIKLCAVGIIGGSIPFALFFTGLAKTSAINAALIHKTLFFWVILLSVFALKERLNIFAGTGVILIFAANLFVGGFTGFKFNTGELMILAATVLWAVENIIAKKALQDISSVIVSGARMVIGSAILFGIMLLFGDVSQISRLDSAGWGWIIVSSILLLGYVLTWYTALKYAPAWYVATLLAPATLVTNVLSVIFITHSMAWQQVVSGGLYVFGALIIAVFARRTFKSEIRNPKSETNSNTQISNI